MHLYQSKLARLLPTSSLLVLQLVPLALIPSLLTGESGANRLILLILVVIATSMFTDALTGEVKVPTATSGGLLPTRGVLAVIAIGLIALAVKTAVQPAFAAQIRGVPTAPLTALVTPFLSWTLIGLAFAFHAFAVGGIGRRRVYLIAGTTIGTYAVLWLANGFVGSTAQLVFAAVWLAVLVGALRLRTVLIAALVALVLWPGIATLRNSIRADAVGTSAHSNSVTYDRLRVDAFLRDAIRLREEGEFSRPGLVQVARVGMVPRLVDRNRQSIATGPILGEAILGYRGTSLGFSTLGNVYLFDGWWGLLIYLALGSLAARVFLARASARSLALYGGLVMNFYWVSTTYPDNIGSFLQFAISVPIAFYVGGWVSHHSFVGLSASGVGTPKATRCLPPTPHEVSE